MAKAQPILLSGIQPSGELHIGNYLGAIKQWVELQKTHRVFIIIVDLHAITVPQEPEKLHENTLKTAGLLLACGIDPEKSTLFIQSHVPAHAELAWILNTITPVGELERMTQYKDKQKKTGVMAGLLNYPVLQAADILLYNPDVVPIGEDQQQHLEFTRTLARRFNNKFGDTFKEPEALIAAGTKRIMGLDDPSQKMSKSASSKNNYIALLDTPDVIRRKIKIAVTDSEIPNDKTDLKFYKTAQPGVANLLAIYAAFSNSTMADTLTSHWHGYSELKRDVSEIVVEKLSEIQEKYREYSKNERKLLDILAAGANEASQVANETLNAVKKKMGFVV